MGAKPPIFPDTFASENTKDQEDLLKKVTYYLSHVATSYNYNDIYNIVVAL